jgi:hypothetical protein
MDLKNWKPSQANWQPYFGCNRNRIENEYSIQMGGGISYLSHLNKPLSQRLWEDIVYRMRVHNLWIIKDGDSEWCLGRGSGSMTIYLDKNNNVSNIYYVP